MKWTILAVILLSGTAHAAEQFQLGGEPEAIQGPYKTEYEWAIAETAADIHDVAAAIRGTRPPGTEALPPKPWNPTLFVPFAQAVIGPVVTKPKGLVPPQYTALSDATAMALVRAGEIISTALGRNPADAAAHESAALVVGVFGLREAADDLTDVRWSLNRMTAHLAVAEALRGARNQNHLVLEIEHCAHATTR